MIGEAMALVHAANLPLAGIHHEVGIILADTRPEAVPSCALGSVGPCQNTLVTYLQDRSSVLELLVCATKR